MLLRRSVLLLLALFACGEPRPPKKKFELGLRTITVAAAVSLKEAFQEIEVYFESSNPGVDVQFTFAGSQLLAAQIAEGAPVDVFASADHAQMEHARSTARRMEPRVFARNRLVIITPKDDTAVQSPQDLGKPDMFLILGVQSSPVGAYAREALARVGVLEAVLPNVISNEENVRGVVHKIATGEARAGIVYATDITEAVADKVRVVPFTGAEDVVPTYEIAVLDESRQFELSESFVEMVFGPVGRKALGERGFLPP